MSTALRGPGSASPANRMLTRATREPWTVELLYGDHEGGQRAVSRFTMLPVTGSDAGRSAELRWLASASRHRNIDRPGPR